MDKRVAVGAVIAVIALVFIGASFTGFFSLPAAETEKGVKIGFIVSQAGEYAVGGEESLQGLLLAEKEINENGGIGGKKLHVIVEDDKSKDKDAITAFRKLVDVDGVKIVIGGQITGPALAIAPIAESEKALFFTTTATAGKLKDAGEYVFMFQSGNEAHVKKISEAMQRPGYKKIGLIYANAEYCSDQVGFLKEEFKERGIEVVAEELYETASTNIGTQLLKLKSAQPEAVYMCGYYEDQGRTIKQAREQGIAQQFFAVTTIENAKFLEIAGNAAEGVIYTSTTFGCDKAKEFCAKYEKEFGDKATYRSAYLYDSLYFISKAIEKAGPDPEKLKSELLKTDFEGIAGKVILDEKGNAEREFALKTVKGGKFVPFDTE